GFRMPRLETHTACPGCGRMIEIRENDPDFFEARFRTGGAAHGADPRKIPGRCPVCGGPPTPKKRARKGSQAGPDKRRGPAPRPATFAGVPVWVILVAGAVGFAVFLRFSCLTLLPLIGRQQALPRPPSLGPSASPAPGAPNRDPLPATDFAGLLGY